jgi:glutamine cyclotransferase
MICSSKTFAVIAALALLPLERPDGAQRRQAPVAGYQLVRSYPHDPDAFTQGLVYRDGFLYESTGQNGKSGIRKVRLETGEVLQIQPLESRYFGEGIAVVEDRIIQLTWQSGVGFVYDRASFQRQRTFTYDGEGWGLTFDGTRIIMSDGTATLRFLDPQTLKETGRVQVREGGRPVAQINELEMVKGELLANVWQTERIVRISPKTGDVLGWIDMRGLLSAAEQARPGVDVMNGIAYDAQKDRLFVTGKNWPKLFEVRVK